MKRALEPGLIVSCQALEGEPLNGCHVMGRMAFAAVQGGAVGIRANGAEDIKEIMAEVNVPVIGLLKQCYSGSPVYITPGFKEIDVLGKTDCDVIATDATSRLRPHGIKLRDIFDYAREKYPDKRLMADISTLEEALIADEMGFDYISSTLCGYTEQTKHCELPDFTLIGEMVKYSRKANVIAEGGIWSPSDMKRIMDLGVYAVVIGTAITRPQEITRRFVSMGAGKNPYT